MLLRYRRGWFSRKNQSFGFAAVLVADRVPSLFQTDDAGTIIQASSPLPAVLAPLLRMPPANALTPLAAPFSLRQPIEHKPR